MPQNTGPAGPLVANRTTCAYLIRGEEVTWRPAVDVNRIVLGAQVVAIVALLRLRAIVKARAKAQR